MNKLHQISCIVCGKVFWTRERQTCSAVCISKFRSQLGTKNNPRIDRICAVCGKIFHSEKPRKTCSRKCLSKLDSQAKAGEYPVCVLDARRNSPILQADENHCLAKRWSLRSPEGKIYKFKNLAHFVRTHKNLFRPEELALVSPNRPAAVFYLGMLRPERKNRRLSWHEWTWGECSDNGF